MFVKIHPSAIVSPKAILGKDVEIGPYTVIEDDVEIGDFTKIGSHCYLHSGTKIGERNVIHSFVNLGGEPQDLSFEKKKKTYLVIGNGNTIREYANIHRSTKEEQPTQIGDENYIMGSVHIAHDCRVGDRNILVHNCVLAGHVVVGNHTVISGHVGIHQFCRVGDYSIIGGLAKVVRDIPPYMMADGNPAVVVGINMVGLRRGNFSEERKRNIKEAYRILYKKGYGLEKAISELEKEFPNDKDIEILVEFLRGTKRGIASGVAAGEEAEIF